MITTDFKEYCNNCKMVDPEAITVDLYSIDYSKIETKIVCKNRFTCEQIYQQFIKNYSQEKPSV